MESAAKRMEVKDAGGRDQAFFTIALPTPPFPLNLYETDTREMTGTWMLSHQKSKSRKSLYECRILGPLFDLFFRS